ncbi:MAG: N-acyl-D-glucosamine 2-epimerase [Chloroflexi bacterium]|nr:MAG: N-acyl-D-glucosamine 2-epimerase [Chloroflexota bacterium]
MNKFDLLAYKSIFEKELKENILTYWMTYAIDKEPDDFYGAVNIKNEPVLTANKSCVLITRILWTFAAAARMFGDERYTAVSNTAYQVLITQFWDAELGGFYMEVAPNGQVANDIKHTYIQAFAIYALCQYYQLNQNEAVMSLIQKSFALFEEKTKDPTHPGYLEAFTRAWQPITENRMADNNEPKSMNTHLHVLEAYAALHDVWPNPLVEKRLRELLLLFLDKIIRESGHLGVFFNDDFNETERSQGICSFGHDIEASWLLCEAADSLKDTSIQTRIRDAAIKMLDAVERVGFDKDGGLFLESYRHGSHVRTNKHWWLQAETLVGFMNGFELTGNSHYWENVVLSWDFINQFVIDHEGGEWFTKVNRLGQPFLAEPEDDPSPYYRNDWKVDPWKCPYHNGRSCMEMIQRIDKLTAQIGD